ncbi:MAG: cadherin-like beta sandwich domain-containing protein, partial [Traorella sp.]
MKKILKYIFVQTILIINIFTVNISAASFNITASVKTIGPNEKFTVSIGGSCAGRVNLTVSNGKLSETSIWVDDGYVKVTVTTGNSGEVKITATPEVGFSDMEENEYNPGPKSVTVKIVSNNNPPGNNEQITTPSTPKSSDNNLKSLTLSVGKLSPDFDSSITDYSVELERDVTKLTINATANHAQASISGVGEKTLVPGENSFKITVTAENGNSKVYTIKAYVDDTPYIFLDYQDKELGVVVNMTNVPKLNSFEETKVVINNEEVKAWYSPIYDFKVIYLQDDTTKNFYIYDENQGIVSKFELLGILGHNLGIVDIDENLQNKQGFTYQEVIVDDIRLMGWVFNQKDFENYALIYALDEKGEYQYYLYEKSENTLQ